MILQKFVDSICDDLQNDTLEFRRKLIRETVPEAESLLVGIFPESNTYMYSARVDRVTDGVIEFRIPTNIRSVKRCFIDGEESFLCRDNELKEGFFSIPERSRQMGESFFAQMKKRHPSSRKPRRLRTRTVCSGVSVAATALILSW